MSIRSYAVPGAGKPFELFEFDSGSLGADDVELAVESCGVCHSDLSMVDNEWGLSAYPLVPGHEVVGKIVQVGESVGHLNVGQRVGLGWFSRSCLVCHECMTGRHNLCPSAEQTIVGRYGGFASRVRAQAHWLVPLPDGIDPALAGPLFCGGITVFHPLLQNQVRPIDRVGVVGIGGLGHMALRFARAWGCEVTAFSTSPEKEAEALSLGAHRFVPTRDASALKKLEGTLDLILVTINQPLDWDLYFTLLKPGGKIHVVGAAPEVTATVFPLLGGQKSFGGSPLGSPATIASMLDFCGRHAIGPVVEKFPMSRVNDAFEHLRAGKARYRIVLTNDLEE